MLEPCRLSQAYLSKASFRFFILVKAPGFTHKHQARPEKLAEDKHFSLLQKLVNYDSKSFITLDLEGPFKKLIKTFD